MNDDLVVKLVLTSRSDEALEVMLQEPVSRVQGQLRGLADPGSDQFKHLLGCWLSALPPLERLQAAQGMVPDSELLAYCPAAARTLAEELRDFASFTDGPDAEIDPAIMERLEGYARELEEMSFVAVAGKRASATGPLENAEGLTAADHRRAMLERHWAGPPDSRDLVELIAGGDQEAAVRMALQHRSEWVDHQLDYESVEDNAEASSDFLQRWLQALPPLERLQATGIAASHYLGAIVWLDHAYGIGGRLTLDAYAGAVAALAEILRGLAGASDVQPVTAQRLFGYADRLDAMSFAPIPLEPEA